MMVRRLLTALAIAGICLGLSTLTARADSTAGDPQGKVQNPPIIGTPVVTSSNFDLLPDGFGIDSPANDQYCSFDSGADTETCTVQNGTNFNWSSLTLIGDDSTSCDSISLSTNLFLNSSCSKNDSGQTVLNFWGVQYSDSTQNLVNLSNTLLTYCNPSSPNCDLDHVEAPLTSNNGPYSGDCLPSTDPLNVPGVLVGCDVQIILGPGADGGNWQTGAPWDAQAPEPAALQFVLFGVAGLGLLSLKRRSALDVR
ncbi:MAG TPA: PEP-CTERM sorting domain-containing protein [Candidatus Limnocylindrales bacterium]|nr:PEP-CTERM sorting domain-containing protein [Candidatus Limnocylindrales bacterium]